MSKKELHRTSIGGQAVIEGVMMRGPDVIATAVRKPNGEVVTDLRDVPKSRKSRFFKLPIVRGCIGFFDSMVIGIKALMFSAEFVEIEDDKPGEEAEALEGSKKKDKTKDAVLYLAVVLSLTISVGLFMLLPNVLIGLVKQGLQQLAGAEWFTENRILLNLFEGLVRIILFLLYLSLTSLMKDMKRVFMYHGAEHKSIHCYESGEELTVENVTRHTRLHPRCGTSFLLIVMVVSIVVFSFISWSDPFTRLALRLLLLPVVAGVSYEIIKFAGRHDNPFTRVISAPGMWLQKITTNEPTPDQIEVAITALAAAIPENKDDDKW